MGRRGPVARRELIRRFRRLGFDGPFSGGKHEFMLRGQITVVIPNPHGSVIGIGLLSAVLRQAGVGWSDWEGA